MVWLSLCVDTLLHCHTGTAVGTISTYNASTGINYILNTGKVTFSQGEQYCRDNGGHLVVYASR